MKVLLDECVDWRLARELPDHEIKTVPQMGWAGIKNGTLLELAEQQFDVFVTVDRNLSYQQNLPKLQIAVVVLHAQTNRLQGLKPLMPAVLKALGEITPGQLVIVTAPTKRTE